MAQGTGTPKVTVAVANGNLERNITVADGVPGIIGTVMTQALIGVVTAVYNYEDAVAKGFTAQDEPFMHNVVKEFYNELGGGKELFILGCEDTMGWGAMTEPTNENGIKHLVNQTQGKLTHIYVCFAPPAGYAFGTDFLEDDVRTAITNAKTLCENLQRINRPVRLLIEGFVNDVNGDAGTAPNTYNNGYVGVVIGGSANDGHASSVALARAVKYGAAVKIGNGLNGALSLDPMYIGNKLVTDFFPEQLDALSNVGYILPTTRDGQAGLYYGVDNMCSQDDYSLLVHGNVIDKAQRIAVAELTPLLETSVRLNQDGTINDRDAKHLEETVRTSLLNNMAGQISDAKVLVPTNLNIINTATGGIKISVLPLGYMTWIDVTIGLTSNSQ